jgi:hypothetical protein
MLHSPWCPSANAGPKTRAVLLPVTNLFHLTDTREPHVSDGHTQKAYASPSGNRTPVSRVTGGDTYHYTNEDWLTVARPLGERRSETIFQMACTPLNWQSQALFLISFHQNVHQGLLKRTKCTVATKASPQLVSG